MIPAKSIGGGGLQVKTIGNQEMILAANIVFVKQIVSGMMSMEYRYTMIHVSKIRMEKPSMITSIQSNLSAQRSPNQARPQSPGEREVDRCHRNETDDLIIITFQNERLEAAKIPCKEEIPKLRNQHLQVPALFGGFQGSGKINPSGIQLQPPSSGQNRIIIMLLLGSKPYRCQC